MTKNSLKKNIIDSLKSANAVQHNNQYNELHINANANNKTLNSNVDTKLHIYIPYVF